MAALVRTRKELIAKRRRGFAVDYLPQDGPRAAERRERQIERLRDRFWRRTEQAHGGPLGQLRAHVDALEAGR